MADETNELAEKLKALAEEAAVGELSDESKIALRELGVTVNKGNLAKQLTDLATQAQKLDGLSPSAKRELAEIGADVSKGLVPRYQFESLGQATRANLLKQGIRIIDVEKTAEKRELNANEIKRSTFDALSQGERASKMKSGFRVVDDAEIK